MGNQALLTKQIIVIMFLLGAAISAIEIYAAWLSGGFGNWRLYFFGLIFTACVLMYFRQKKQRDRRS